MIDFLFYSVIFFTYVQDMYKITKRITHNSKLKEKQVGLAT